jgi:hypothetical protein
LIKKYKLKNGRQPAKTVVFGKYYEKNVHRYWRGERVAVIKGWSVFVHKIQMVVDKLCIKMHT